MGYSEEHQAIKARLVANWDQESVPVAWPNYGSNSGGSFVPPVDRPYMRFYVAPGEARQLTIGDPAGQNRYRHLGLIVMQLYVFQGQGDGEALELADTAAAIFRNQKFSGVWSLTPRINTIGETPDGRYQINVTIPYQRDEVL